MTNIQEKYLLAIVEVCKFVLPEDQPKVNNGLSDELKTHSLSFFHRAIPFYQAENRKRWENNKAFKTIESFAHDFIFSALGHGVGYWENGENDWLYYGDQLQEIAEKYFYPGASVLVDDDGFLQIE